jgi:copper chaperone
LSVKWFVQACEFAAVTAVQPQHPDHAFSAKERTDMCGTDSRNELPLTAAEPSGCACCSTEAAAQAPVAVEGTEYYLEGLTCGHCVGSVEKAVAAVDRVEAVSVELVPGGTSRLTVTGPAADTAVREAVSAAGYSVAGSR